MFSLVASLGLLGFVLSWGLLIFGFLGRLGALRGFCLVCRVAVAVGLVRGFNVRLGLGAGAVRVLCG